MEDRRLRLSDSLPPSDDGRVVPADATATGADRRVTRRDVSVIEAAYLLGVTPDALRSRLRRRTLEGYRDNLGRWRVVLPDTMERDDDGRPTAVRQPSARALPTVADSREDRDEVIAELTDELAEMRTRAAVAETLRDEYRTRIDVLKDALERERRRADAAEQSRAEQDRRLDEFLHRLSELHEEVRRRPWPGLRTWWRRLWEGEDP